MEIRQYSLTARRPLSLLSITIRNCNFVENRKPPTGDGPILDFISVDVYISKSTFIGSNTSAITLRNTYLNLYDDILFANNTAIIGGALKLCDSSLIIAHHGTNVTFLNNRAQKGGAIYFQQACMDTTPTCAFQLSFPRGTTVEEISKHVRFTFTNNSAQIAGDAIYGGSLDRCSTIVPFTRKGLHYPSYKLSMYIYQKIFLKNYQNSTSWITSNPRQACFCGNNSLSQARINSDGTVDCITTYDTIKAYPGESFTLSLITVGQMNGSTSGTVEATLEHADSDRHSLVKLNHPEASSLCTGYKFAIHSNMAGAVINFRAQTSEMVTRYHTIPVKVNVTLLPCPLGFQLSPTPPHTCVCSPLLLQLHKKYGFSPVVCDISNKVISVPQGKLWFGCSDPTYGIDSNYTCSSQIIAHNCGYNCNQSGNVINVSISELDGQCLLGHTGVMCGACKPGYSRILGDVYECKKDCTNINLIYLLPLLLASGFLVILFISLLDLTVSTGTINGLLVYAMIIQVHSHYLRIHYSPYAHFCWVFISWINLIFGIKTCYYKGMDAYQQVWILIGQASYFLLIQALIIYLTRRFIFFTRLFGRNIVKVLATLFFAMYSNIVFIACQTFNYTELDHSDGSTHSIVWYSDGNLPYLGPKHAPLFTVAIFCSFIVSFYVMSLLFIQCLQKRSGLWCFRWVNTLRPFYDAYTGPCNDAYRFWPGFLLFIRTGLYIVNSSILTYGQHQNFFQVRMLVTAAICVLVMSLACIFPHGVYKKWPLNVLEFSYFLNLCVTCAMLGNNAHTRDRNRPLMVSISIAAVTFLGIVVYRFYCQVKDTKMWRKLDKCLSVRSKRISHHKVDENDLISEERDHLLPHQLPAAFKFN